VTRHDKNMENEFILKAYQLHRLWQNIIKPLFNLDANQKQRNSITPSVLISSAIFMIPS